MLIPKRTKYRKQFRGKMGGVATKGNKVDFGEFGLAAREFGWITSRQIEACRVTINRTFKREGKIWIRIFLINLIQKDLKEQEWVKVKVMQKVG